MSRPSDHASSPRHLGFSLVEMLVALVFMSVLMAGLMRIYASSLQGFTNARESIAAQRANRWALATLEDDLQSAGFYFPLRPVPGFISVASGQQNPMLVLPNQKLKFDTRKPDGTLVEENLVFDEIQVLTDIPLPISAQLSDPPVDNSTVSIVVTGGSLSDVQAGDFMVIMDSNYETALIKSVTGTTVTLNMDASVTQDQETGSPTGVSPGLKSLDHRKNAEVMFIRPNQVVRYSIQAESLDPAEPKALVPSVIREQVAYPTNGVLIDWKALAAAPPATYQRQRISENVDGMRMDLSANGGQNWVRSAVGATQSGTSGWDAMVAAINTQVASNPTPYNSINNSANPLWYRGIPVVFRIDMETRSPNLRAESSTTGTTLAFRKRTQTLFVTPRNFTFGL